MREGARQTFLHQYGDRLGASLGAEFPHARGDVLIGCGVGEVEGMRYLFGAKAQSAPEEALPFPLGKVCDGMRRWSLALCFVVQAMARVAVCAQLRCCVRQAVHTAINSRIRARAQA